VRVAAVSTDIVPHWLDVKNSRRVALWRWRWHLQAGSRFWVARDLQDLRNEEDLRRWREIEGKRRQLPKRFRKVVKINSWRFANARRRSRLQATA
jgi:hypothetical protein